MDGRRLPIILDAELVDMSFGTGAVKVRSFSIILIYVLMCKSIKVVYMYIHYVLDIQGCSAQTLLLLLLLF